MTERTVDMFVTHVESADRKLSQGKAPRGIFAGLTTALKTTVGSQSGPDHGRAKTRRDGKGSAVPASGAPQTLLVML